MTSETDTEAPQHNPAEHMSVSPHSGAIGLRYVSHSEDRCVLAIDWAEHLVGDPDTGVIHGGAITALLDTASGMVARPKDMHRDVAAIATLDMRIDYMNAAEPRREIFAEAHCFRRTTNVAFVRALAYQDTADDPIATCTATFMLGTPNTPFAQRAEATS